MLLPTRFGPAGTMMFYCAITALGGFWAWCFVPETAGRSLEDMDKLFDLQQTKWYNIGRHGASAADERSADGCGDGRGTI